MDLTSVFRVLYFRVQFLTVVFVIVELVVALIWAEITIDPSFSS